MEWYNGDTIHHETSEELMRSLDNPRLHTRTSGSDYVNKSWLYTNELNSQAMPISALTHSP